VSPALGPIDGLKDALARLRKFGGRCVLGFQSNPFGWGAPPPRWSITAVATGVIIAIRVSGALIADGANTITVAMVDANSGAQRRYPLGMCQTDNAKSLRLSLAKSSAPPPSRGTTSASRYAK
jgi:hypothetical protein